MNYVTASDGRLIAIFNLLQIKTSMDIFDTKKCKATFSLMHIILGKIK